MDLGGNNVSIGSLTDGAATSGTITSSAVGGTPVLTVGGLGASTTFSGVISDGAGTTALVKVGNGALTLTGNSTFTGGATISGGSLQLGNGATANGSVVSNITNNSTVVFANPAVQVYNGAVSGSGQLVKTGPGLLTLTAPQGYAGPTVIAAGTLQLGGSSATISGFGANTSGDGSNSTWTVNSANIATAAVTNNVLTVTDNNDSQARTVFCNTPVPAGAFTANFIYTVGGSKISDGATFMLQDDPRGLNAIGSAGGGLGYN